MSLASIVFALGLAAPEAQAVAPSLPPAVAAGESAERGVIAYPPGFFAASRPSTALDMINRLPGFSLDSGGDVRGFASAAGNVLVNGERPTTKSERLQDILTRISASAVERVELIRGGAPGVDMQGRTILANVVIKSSAQVEIVANLQTYLYPDGLFGPLLELQASRRDGINQIEGSLRATVDRTEQSYDGGARVRSDGQGQVLSREALKGYDQIQDYVARGAIQRGVASGKLKVNGKVEYSSFDRDVTYTRVFPGPGREESGETDHDWTGEFGARYDRKLAPVTDLQLVFLQNLGRDHYGSTADKPGDHQVYSEIDKTGETILRGELKHLRSSALSLEASLEGAYNLLDGATRYQATGAAPALSAVKVEELRGEAAGKAVWRASPKLTVEAGARLELSRITQSGDNALERSFFYPKPRLLATWNPTGADQLRVRLEREVGQLNFGDFIASADLQAGTSDGADAQLRPSRSWVGEAAYERRFWGAGSVSLTLTHAEIQDAADYKPLRDGSGLDAPSNIGDGTSDQLVFLTTLPTDRLGLSGGLLKTRFSWFDSAVTDPVTHERRRLTGATPFVCNVNFTRDMPGGRWSWGASRSCANEYSRFRINELRTTRNEPYLETFVEWKPRPDLTVRTTLSNLSSRNITRRRYLYDGSRDSRPLAIIEDRSIPFDPYLFIQVRKRLG